jgi:hypothetical protein
LCYTKKVSQPGDYKMQLSDLSKIWVKKCRFPYAKTYYLDGKAFDTAEGLIEFFLKRKGWGTPDWSEWGVLGIEDTMRLYELTWANKFFWWCREPVKVVWVKEAGFEELHRHYQKAPYDSIEEEACRLRMIAHVLERLIAPQQEQICEIIE